MANNTNASFMSTGSQSKPPNLIGEEYPQWKDIWDELERRIEGGKKTLKNNRSFCIDEYHSFKAKQDEYLSDTYSRFNTLISNNKRYGVIRSPEDNNSLFLKCLGAEWIHLTMSVKATLDLEAWTLADLFGSLKSQEPQLREKDLRRRKIKKNKVLIAESDESSEEEVSMKEIMKTLALITREYRRGGKRRNYRGSARRSYRKGDRKKECERREIEQKVPQTVEEQRKDDFKEGRFKCGKPGNFAVECLSKGPRVSQKGPKDAGFFKRKAEYYTQKFLLAQTSELVTDESSDEEAQKINDESSDSTTSEKKPHVSTWVVDSGCLRHMTGNLELLSSYLHVERMNKTIVEAARTMLNASGLPLTFWAEAVSTACFNQNRSLVVKRFEKTPYQLLHDKRPNIKFFHVFGCKCYVLNDRESVGKFDPKGDDAIFIGMHGTL
ncbi:hypothetical protein OSB04_011070 [Centaurea solstitialis]|uniref:Retrovirus-related Pol polyprotein from transposon TNT 1-94 n=1 Tax=Centaurea solstitialis TaxID=347529 RepID=A0AA38TLW4_9ASTR|nr:hypothetical protein OSB04_011070 [Centaurea solstitialis]